MTRSGNWEALEGQGPEAVVVEGVELGPGSRVRLRPRPGADVLDGLLQDKIAIVEGFNQDLDDQVQAVVILEDDPGRDLGWQRQPGHRFFFLLEEIQPLDASAAPKAPSARILVAGIGNIFLGDDAFGVQLAARLRDAVLPPGVEVADFGIRGMDLAYALQGDYSAVVFLDATPRGGTPGTVYVIEPELETDHVALDAHGMDPVRVIALARHMGRVPERILVVGCEPQTVMTGEETELVGELSAPVQAALSEAVAVVQSLLEDLASTKTQKESEG